MVGCFCVIVMKIIYDTEPVFILLLNGLSKESKTKKIDTKIHIYVCVFV